MLGALLAAAPLAAQQREGEALDAVLAREASRGAPGCAAAVERDGTLLAARGYGLADRDKGMATTPSTAFYAGSVSKQFVATVIVRLAAAGRLALDDPASRFLPELHPALGRATIRQMLHHTAGIPDYLGLATRAGRDWSDHFTNAEGLALVFAQDSTDFSPGTRYRYSNGNYLLLAEIAARATGRPFRAVADSLLFAPLDMRHSTFRDRLDLTIPALALGYRTGADSAWVPWPLDFAAVGSGGLYTTATDLARWSGHWWHEAPTASGWHVTDTLDVRGVLASGDTISYGLGVILGSYRGLPVRRHDGGLAGYRSAVLQFPSRRTGIVVLCNGDRSAAPALAEGIADRILDFPDPLRGPPSPP